MEDFWCMVYPLDREKRTKGLIGEMKKCTRVFKDYQRKSKIARMMKKVGMRQRR